MFLQQSRQVLIKSQSTELNNRFCSLGGAFAISLNNFLLRVNLGPIFRMNLKFKRVVFL